MCKTKKGFKKGIALILSIVMTLSLMPISVLADDYSGHWAQSSIERAVQAGWFARNDAGTYRPNASITRAEFVTMVNRMKGYSEKGSLAAFTDVKTGDWYYDAFATAVGTGFITGSNGKLSPSSNITRNEAVTIFARISGLDINAVNQAALVGVADSASIPAWATPYASAAIAQGLIAGSNGAFNGNNNITRAETAVLLERLNDDVRVFGFAGEYSVGSVRSAVVASTGVTLKNTTVSGTLTVSEAVGDGTVYLEGITAETLEVDGGGMNSVYISNSIIKLLKVVKDAVRILFQNGSSAGSASISGSNGSLEFADGTTVDDINIEREADSADVIIGDGVEVDNLTVNGPSTTVTTGEGSSVDSLVVGSTAGGTTINTGEGSEIGSATFNAGTTVTGEGEIGTANINANGVTMSTEPETTNMADNTVATVAGGEVAGEVTESGSDTTTTTGSGMSGGGGGGGGGGTTTTTKSIVAKYVARPIGGQVSVTNVAANYPKAAKFKVATNLDETSIVAIDASVGIMYAKKGDAVTITLYENNGTTVVATITKNLE